MANRIVSIIDDEIDIAVLLGDALRSVKGISVFTFTDPIMALEHFNMNKDFYALVISDLRMPGLNGMDLLKKIKESNNHVTTILTTAFEVDDRVFHDYTKRKIINGIIQKPFNLPDLVKEVNTKLEIQKVSQ